eukprot:409959-Hanusia_phi.AAC.2
MGHTEREGPAAAARAKESIVGTRRRRGQNTFRAGLKWSVYGGGYSKGHQFPSQQNGEEEAKRRIGERRAKEGDKMGGSVMRMAKIHWRLLCLCFLRDEFNFSELFHRDPLKNLKLHLGGFSYKQAEAVNSADIDNGELGTNIAQTWNVHFLTFLALTKRKLCSAQIQELSSSAIKGRLFSSIQQEPLTVHACSNIHFISHTKQLVQVIESDLSWASSRQTKGKGSPEANPGSFSHESQLVVFCQVLGSFQQRPVQLQHFSPPYLHSEVIPTDAASAAVFCGAAGWQWVGM